MFQWIRALFRHQEELVRSPVRDEILGEITFDPRLKLWEVRLQSSVREVGIVLGGDLHPDPNLIAHARDITMGFQGFEKGLREFLSIEAQKRKPDDGEVRTLELEEIALYGQIDLTTE